MCLAWPDGNRTARSPALRESAWSLLPLSVECAGSIAGASSTHSIRFARNGRPCRKKGRPAQDAPVNHFADGANYGVRTRKNRTGSETLIGMALENAPLPFKVPETFVVQLATGITGFVAVNTV